MIRYVLKANPKLQRHAKVSYSITSQSQVDESVPLGLAATFAFQKHQANIYSALCALQAIPCEINVTWAVANGALTYRGRVVAVSSAHMKAAKRLVDEIEVKIGQLNSRFPKVSFSLTHKQVPKITFTLTLIKR